MDVLSGDQIGGGRNQEQHQLRDMHRFDALLQALIFEDPVVVLLQPIGKDPPLGIRNDGTG